MRALQLCRKGHKFVMFKLLEFAAGRKPAKLVCDRISGFAAAHDPPRLQCELDFFTSVPD